MLTGAVEPSVAKATSRPGAPAVHAARQLVSAHPAAVTAWCSVILVTLAAGVTFYVARSYLLPIFAAFVLSVLLAPLVGALEARRAPPSVAAAVAVLAVCLLAYVSVALVAAPAARWAARSPEILASVGEHLERFQSTVNAVHEISNELEEMTGDVETTEVVLQGQGLTQSLAMSARAMLVQTLFILVMTYFLLITRKQIRIKAIAAQPRLGGRLRTARAFRDVERRVAVYLLILAIVNLGLGASVATVMWLLGVPSPIMWGGLAAALNFLPFVGPTLMTMLLAAAGLATFDTLAGAALAPAAYLALNFLESNLVTPLVVSGRMTLNPLAILLAISFWTWIWGPLGGLLSVPLLIMLKVVCDHTTALQPLGSSIGGPLPRHAVKPSIKVLSAHVLAWRRPWPAWTPARPSPGRGPPPGG
jgi:predicted PurR-regulated permease PerM